MKNFDLQKFDEFGFCRKTLRKKFDELITIKFVRLLHNQILKFFSIVSYCSQEEFSRHRSASYISNIRFKKSTISSKISAILLANLLKVHTQLAML